MGFAAKPNKRAGLMSRVAFGAGMACLIGLPSAALAQASAPAQGGPSRDDLTVGQSADTVTRPSNLSVEDNIERGPCPLAEPSFAGSRVSFSDISFSGLPGVDASILDKAWRDSAGQDLPIADLCVIRDRAATILRAKGFLAAVQIPAQRIEPNGTVQMDVLAAKLVEVQLRGDPGNSGDLIAAHLSKLTDAEWFNSIEAERHLLLMQDLPGFDVRLVLRSAEGSVGEVVGDVVVERVGFEASAGAQNLASPGSGRVGGFVDLALNDLTGNGDRTSLSIYSTFDIEEQQVFRLGHELALGSDGLRFGADVLYGQGNPAGGPFESETVVAGMHLRYPLLRTQAQSVWGTVGFDMINQTLNFGATRLSKDKLRVAYLQLDHQIVDPISLRGGGGYSPQQPHFSSFLSLELRKGLSGFGASDACVPITNCLAPNTPISDFSADPSFFTARLQGSFQYRPMRNLTLSYAPLFQFSDGHLLSYEQVSLGNYTVGRGIDPGVAIGDGAGGGAFELRYGSLIPSGPEEFAFEPFTFFDFARTWVDGNASGLGDPANVYSIGAGLRARYGNHFDLGLTFAVPLAKAGYQTKKGPARVLFTFTTRLLSWGK